MGLLRNMAAVAAECIGKPGRVSVWSQRLGKYVCSDDPEYQPALSEHLQLRSPERPPIDATFKLVFLTAAIGTLLFVGICVVVTLLAGKDMPGPLDKLVTGLFDLAKIGFGAVVGLLGAKALGERSLTT
jgi:hypothetical protein